MKKPKVKYVRKFKKGTMIPEFYNNIKEIIGSGEYEIEVELLEDAILEDGSRYTVVKIFTKLKKL